MWKEITGYDRPYRVNEKGQFQQFKGGTWRYISSEMNRVSLLKDGKRLCKGAARIMFETFIRPLNEGELVHLSGPLRLENLVVMSRYELNETVCFRDRSGHRRAVQKVDEQGNVLAEYPSLAQAARENFYSYSSAWRKCAGSVRHEFRFSDFTFRHKEDG